ncbi:centromere protein M-like [Orbicella faveolata]|uniref:centromere protein M-like n=1 Tax=Orbicella faveolata TaxID=48498 RepID=UPI0009E23B7C|nr:centromere protein M-like [Orbicella faveolata]
MAEIPDKNVNILSRFTKLPDKNQATVLFVGVKGIGKHRIARSMLGIHTEFSLQIRVATSLPLPEDTENTRPRIDFIVLFIDLTNNLR